MALRLLENVVKVTNLDSGVLCMRMVYFSCLIQSWSKFLCEQQQDQCLRKSVEQYDFH